VAIWRTSVSPTPLLSREKWHEYLFTLIRRNTRTVVRDHNGNATVRITVGGQRDETGRSVAELLLRRPDVAQAEANLAAAHANLDAARAAFLPQFALTGNGGFAGTAINALLHGPNFAWDFGANLLQTVFDGGKLLGQKNLAQATQQELIASYQSAVLSAYADVEDALGQVTNNSNAEIHLGREVEAAREAFKISQLQYRQGATDLLTVLQAQQTLFSAEDQLAQTTLAHMQAVVHLFEALGGGWVEPTEERTQFASGM
jgi:multidrug efflux system outer membrane protein